MTKKNVEKICRRIITCPFLVICNIRSKEYVIQVYSSKQNEFYTEIEKAFHAENFSVKLLDSPLKNIDSSQFSRFDIQIVKRDDKEGKI